ncbi:hypothetical protein K1719_021081 [Acacia pycnantha]|nr:hypothetical protein K1719_021081 [Acacia pycnantha]
MSAVEAEKNVEEEKEVVRRGELLFCGGTCWDIIGRRKGPADGNLFSPTRLRPLVGIDIRFVASGCASCHCVALDVEGRCYTWGRNEKGQLGHGDTIQRDRPTVVSEANHLSTLFAFSGAGRSHTVVVTEDGHSLAFGWNKHGQLGSGSAKNEIESSPVRCLVSEVSYATCGGDFTVWLSSVEGSSILTAGLPQYGQLGHGTDNERRRICACMVILVRWEVNLPAEEVPPDLVNSVGVEVLEFIADFGKPTAPLPAAMGPRIDGTKIHDEETGLFNAVLQMALPINYKVKPFFLLQRKNQTSQTFNQVKEYDMVPQESMAW